MLDLEAMLFHVGEFGTYQKMLFIFQAPFCIFLTFVSFGQIFMVLYPMNYWCESHFGCITPDSVASAAQRRNISFAWRSGVFRSDPCQLNDINEAFLAKLNSWDNRNCASDRSRPCEYTDRRRNSGQLSSHRNTVSRHNNNPSSGKTISEDDPETESYREKRSYGPYGSFRDSAANYPARRTSTESPTVDHKREHGSNSREHDGQQVDGGHWRPSSDMDDDYNGDHLENVYGKGEKKGNLSGLIYLHGNSRNPDRYKSSSKSSANNTDVTQGYAGWSQPHCASRTRRRFNLGNNTIILAERMQRRYENKSWENIERCNKVRWNRSELPYETIVTEGNWYCNAELYIAFSQAVFFVGAIVGGVLINGIADRFGRVPALATANILGAVGGALSAVSTNVWVFSFFRFITGMAFDNCFTMMYILVLEYCGPSYRTVVANVSIAVFYTLGTLIVPLLAWLINDWRIFALAISLPMLLGIPALFIVPESVRWLLSRGRVKEATNVFRNIAKVNKMEVDESVFTTFEQEATKLFSQLEDEENELGVTAALQTPRLRRTFILLCILWALIALVYESHSRNIINMANEQISVFWMFGLASMTELPADIFIIFTLDRLGRRWLAFGAMTLSGIFSFIAAALASNFRIGFLIVAIISRFWVNVAFNIGIQYAAELLPTVIRAQGVTVIHDTGYFASILSPFVAAIGRSSPSLSLILLGGFAIAAGIVSLFLSETLGEDLPNTIEEAENFGRKQSFWSCPLFAKEPEDAHVALPRIILDEGSPVVFRNVLKGSTRGEVYRSSIISNASSGGYRQSFGVHPGDNNLLQVPEPTELTRLRRVTH